MLSCNSRLYLKNKCKLLPLYVYWFWDNQTKALPTHFQDRKSTNYRLTRTKRCLILSIYEIPSVSTTGNTNLLRDYSKSNAAILLGVEYFPNLPLHKCGLWIPFLTDREKNFWIWIEIYRSAIPKGSPPQLPSTQSNEEVCRDIQVVSQRVTHTKRCTNNTAPMGFATLSRAKWVPLHSTVNLYVTIICLHGRFHPFCKTLYFFFLPSQSQKHMIYGYNFPAYLVPVEPYNQEILCEDPKVA